MNQYFIFLPVIAILISFIQCSSLQKTDSGVAFVTVEQWGGERFTGEYQEHELVYITLHHGGVPFLIDADPGEYLRNLQTWSRTDRGWIDIPYHYLIDLEGRIYEGRDIRYAGDTNTDYDPTGHALVCVLGNYEEVEPNEVQLQAIADLFAWICETYSIAPETLKGHKDYVPDTVCPGHKLYTYLENGMLVERVKANMMR